MKGKIPKRVWRKELAMRRAIFYFVITMVAVALIAVIDMYFF